MEWTTVAKGTRCYTFNASTCISIRIVLWDLVVRPSDALFGTQLNFSSVFTNHLSNERDGNVVLGPQPPLYFPFSLGNTIGPLFYLLCYESAQCDVLTKKRQNIIMMFDCT